MGAIRSFKKKTPGAESSLFFELTKKMDFEKMEPIFGQLKVVEWSVRGGQGTEALKPFLFLVQSLPDDPSTLRIIVTDFHSNTFEALKSTPQLEDMRDSVGIGGSWSEFINYVMEALKSEDVKLVMEGCSESGGATNAKLVAQKAKGMPRISISLAKLVDSAANVSMGNLSLALYGAYKDVQTSLIDKEERCRQLAKSFSAEQAKNGTLQKELEAMFYTKRQRFESVNENTTLAGISASPDKQARQNHASTKASTRVVPAHRRARVRGVILQDSEDDDAQD